MRSRTRRTAAIAAVLALAAPAAAQGRVVTAESVLPPGQSGFVPAQGSNPHLSDQIPLFETFSFKPATFDPAAASTESPKPGVTITRDAYGVPDVHAGNDRDAWFGAGYAIAQDRLVQLELFRRGTKGTLAEILGESRLDDDIAARRDYYTDAELRRMLRSVSPSLRARFGAYADGVNAWAAKAAADPSLQPAEFTLLGLRFAKWTALDSARIGVQLARTIPSSDGAELANWTALRRLGAKRFDRLMPLHRSGQATTVPAANGRFPSTPGRTRADEKAGFRASQRFLRGVKAPGARASTASASSPGLLPAHGGSDAWAVRGPGHKAYLFTGPQLGFAVPDMLVELEVHRPGLDARGVTAAGLPVIGIGHNAHIAWADTSGLSDTNDLYAEKLVGATRYRYKGKVRRMRCRTATFKVALGSPHTVRLCRTVHGPVQARAGSHWAFARRYAIWGHEMDTLTGLAQLNEARSVKQAGKAIAKVSWNENTMVADDRGTIGWWHPGRLPIRPQRWDERLPFPGTGRAEWRGLLKFRQVPHVVNPKRGWLVNWNNQPSAGWTNGDAEAKERVVGELHRANYLAYLVSRVANHPTYDAVKAVDRSSGTIVQQLRVYKPAVRAAADGAPRRAKTVLNTILAWDGSYDRTDANGTVDPGLAAWRALKTAVERRVLPAAARSWLGTPGSSHAEDVGGAAGVALLEAGTRDLRAAAGSAANALRKRYGSADPAAWRAARPMYDVDVLGVAPQPAMKFFDRGTWQQAVELGP